MSRRTLTIVVALAALITLAAVVAITDGTSNTRIGAGATLRGISITKVIDKSTPVLAP